MNLSCAYLFTNFSQLAEAGPATEQSTAVHIGNLIREYLAKEPKSHTVTWFARRLNCHRVNVYDIFRRSTIDTALLWRISAVLNHNFFSDIASEFDGATNPEENHENS